MQKVIDSSIEIFDQLNDFIESINDSVYQDNSSNLFESSIGQHLRHILDIYHALIRNMEDDVVDYDIRLRGSLVETNRHSALCTLNDIRAWLVALSPETINRHVKIKTEIAISEQHSSLLETSFGRELFFASNHTIHHLALMVTIAKVQGYSIGNHYGVAPATATYNREQAQS
ncbi:DinB family protein [Neptunomonas sp.]|uniref:DinB family protein n=1 Tax=Neptunomonas sp. TaxID=1971898 RepID=UPI0025D80D9F|nr:DinB family protein [Neptunomonas sp.]